ncbi:MAG: CoB--CoM heterodisulfide reductase iron-sulfur subunit A family protein, partial [Syntrophaceae bacterium]|nr:CoB--CoM heterodisulfide reductase iron-sulfur subunit A family protein [Syntrophaceae bacterium]
CFRGFHCCREAAEAGSDVVIVEKNPYLGGRVTQLNKYFWKMCPPNCGLEIQYKRIKNNGQVTIYTMAEVGKISGTEGNFDVTINIKPRFVNDKCTGCNKCAEACPVERKNDFDFGMSTTKSAYLPHNQAFPLQYVIDEKTCKGPSCAKCVEACKYDAIHLDMKPQTVSVKVGAVVMATGWNPYDATKMDNLGFGTVQNVVTNMMMERLAAPNGPTGGKIVRPSDGKEVKNIAFVQCAGSRDENHLPFCSYICCLASIKQATYIRELYPDSKAKIFYIDMRTPGLYENRFYTKIKADANVSFLKGKVARVEQAPNGDVKVTAEDIHGGSKITETFDMVVLATGMQPTAASLANAGVAVTDDGFVDQATLPKGIYATGTLKTPVDVARSAQDATGVVMKSIQSLRRK